METNKQVSAESVYLRAALKSMQKALAALEKKYDKQNKAFWLTVTETNKWGSGTEAEKLDVISNHKKSVENSIAIISNLLDKIN